MHGIIFPYMEKKIHGSLLNDRSMSLECLKLALKLSEMAVIAWLDLKTDALHLQSSNLNGGVMYQLSFNILQLDFARVHIVVDNLK